MEVLDEKTKRIIDKIENVIRKKKEISPIIKDNLSSTSCKVKR